MIKVKDRIILGMISGMIGTIPPQLLDAAEHKMGLSDIPYAQLAAKLFIPTKKTATPGGKTLASLINFINGGLVGVVTVYLLSLTGRDKAIIKSVGTHTVLWVMINGLLSHVGLKIKSEKPLAPIVSLFNHIVAGTVCGFLITKLGDDGLFPDEQIKNQKQIPVVYTGNTKNTTQIDTNQANITPNQTRVRLYKT